MTSGDQNSFVCFFFLALKGDMQPYNNSSSVYEFDFKPLSIWMELFLTQCCPVWLSDIWILKERSEVCCWFVLLWQYLDVFCSVSIWFDLICFYKSSEVKKIESHNCKWMMSVSVSAGAFCQIASYLLLCVCTHSVYSLLSYSLFRFIITILHLFCFFYLWSRHHCKWFFEI